MNSPRYIRASLVVTSLWVGVGLSIAALSLIGTNALGQPRENPVSETANTFLEAGVLEPVECVDLRNEAGQPLPLLFIASSGQMVKKGDRLAELDASTLVEKRMRQVARVQKAKGDLTIAQASMQREERATNGQIEIAEKALRLAQKQLMAYKGAEYPNQLIDAQNEVKLASERLSIMEGKMRWLEENRKKEQDGEATEPAPEEIQFLEARMALLEAKMRVQSAQDRLTFLQQHLREQRLAELELAIAQREFDLARAKDVASEAAVRGRAAMTVSETNLQIASSRLSRLEQQIAASTVFAPRDGAVVLPNGISHTGTGAAVIKVGDTIGIGQTLLRLGDMAQLKVTIPASARVARRIRAGDPAAIRVDAFPDRTFSGRVTSVLAPSEVPNDYNRGRIVVTIDNPANDLRAGMTAKVELDLSRRQ